MTLKELEKKKKQEAIYKLELKQLLDVDENLSEWSAIFSVRISQSNHEISKLRTLVEEQEAINAASMAEMEKYVTLLRLTRQKIDTIQSNLGLGISPSKTFTEYLLAHDVKSEKDKSPFVSSGSLTDLLELRVVAIYDLEYLAEE